MKKTVLIFLILLFGLTEACKNDDNIETYYNNFGLFDNQSLVVDSNFRNQIQFIEVSDTAIVFSRDSILYSFNIEKIIAIFSEDVYTFFDINNKEFSALKQKKFNESEELKFKKEYLNDLKKSIENTIIFSQQKFNCEDKYNLKEGVFHLTNTIKDNDPNFSVNKILFKPKDEDIALFIEENCDTTIISLLSTLIVDLNNKTLLFNPLKVDLLYNQKKLEGEGILQNIIIEETEKIKSTKKKQKININELSLELPSGWKKFQDRKTYKNGSVLILSYTSKSKIFIAFNINKEKYEPIRNQNVYDFEDEYTNHQLKRGMPSARLITKRKEKIDGYKSLYYSFSEYDKNVNYTYKFENNIVFIGNEIYTITFNYDISNQAICTPIINEIKESIRFN